MRRPNANVQASRLTPQFRQLGIAMEERRILLQDNPMGIQPEQVLVIEIAGLVDEFIRAVRRVPGLEWLAEIEVDEMEARFGFENPTDAEGTLRGQLFLVMTNQVALRELLSLFIRWKRDPASKMPHGQAKWKNVFSQLQTIRTWNAMDRVQLTGVFDDWTERLRTGDLETVPVEVELWYRADVHRQREAEQSVSSAIESYGGQVVQRCIKSEISYHALLGKLPIGCVHEIVENPGVRLLQCEEVMFFRPVGQFLAFSPEDAEVVEPSLDPISSVLPTGEPVIGLLDGLPLENHELLDGRLVVDDPDGFAAQYQANDRRHGTAMASLICHGDLSESGVPISKPLYVRPIMQPSRLLGNQSVESVPETILAVDLVHRAVRRMFRGDDIEPATAPSVRIVNLSICDKSRPFTGAISSLARLLDWLSDEYNILFIVSAGNYAIDVTLDVPRQGMANKSASQVEEAVIKSTVADTRNRSILSPSETVNGVTVGSAHIDHSSFVLRPHQVDPSASTFGLPSVISAHGPGYRRSIKPEILLPGGRQLLSEKIGNTSKNAVFEVLGFVSPPGQCVAAPSGSTASLNRRLYTTGTSNAAAVASRYAGFFCDMIDSLRMDEGEDIPSRFDAVLAKALLVHGASWGAAGNRYESIVRSDVSGRMLKSFVGRFLGYGLADVMRVLDGSEQRVTALGYGDISDGEGHEYSFPLPPSLSATTEWRRLTVTLAWFTPVRTTNQKYRMAHLWFSPRDNDLASERSDSDFQAVQRGTLQHEVFEGTEAVAFSDGASLNIKISCRSDVDFLSKPVQYGLAVTLEVAENAQIPIYQEVRDRLAIRVRV